MTIRNRAVLFSALAALASMPALGQSWAAGAALGVTEDVSHRFSLDELRSRDVAAWVQYQIEPDIELRTTFGTLRTTGAHSERTVDDVAVPRLTERIDYVTVGAVYEFVSGDFGSGVFGGIGGYRIRPATVPAGFERFRDQRETVLGWHLGAEETVRIVSRLSIVGRLAVHGFRSGDWRAILSATAGAAYRF